MIQQELLADQYHDWISHPVTKILLDNLRKHKNTFVNLLSDKASDSNVSDEQFRLYGCGLRNTDAILKMILNYDTFIQQINKQ